MLEESTPDFSIRTVRTTKHSKLLLLDKVDMISMKEKGISNAEIARIKGVSAKTVRNALKNKEIITRTAAVQDPQNSLRTKRSRRGEAFPLIERVVDIWFNCRNMAGVDTPRNMLRDAAQTANALMKGYETCADSNWDPSHGWMTKFKERHAIRYKLLTSTRESGDVSNNTTSSFGEQLKLISIEEAVEIVKSEVDMEKSQEDINDFPSKKRPQSIEEERYLQTLEETLSYDIGDIEMLVRESHESMKGSEPQMNKFFLPSGSSTSPSDNFLSTDAMFPTSQYKDMENNNANMGFIFIVGASAQLECSQQFTNYRNESL